MKKKMKRTMTNMKKKYLEHVMNTFDLEEARKICCADFSYFAKHGTLIGDKPEEQYYFKDNGSKILAVAHLDSVQSVKFCDLLKHPHGWRLYSPSLDDRLGVYVILCMLPKLGIKPDILLTNFEENGDSTAEFFKTEKKYNWMFSFDRTGQDVVSYQYKDKTVDDLLKKHDFESNHGSFSCIGKLEHLKIKGFNFGVGYENYHDMYAYAPLLTVIRQVAKFTRFFLAEKNHHMEHRERAITVYNRDSYSRNYYDNGGECEWMPEVGEYKKCSKCGRYSSLSLLEAQGKCSWCPNIIMELFE
jgi:hypothetical protein